MQYAIRPPELQDLAYIHDSWRSSYEGSGYAKLSPKWFYRLMQAAKVTAMLNRSTVQVVTLPDDRDLIVAWSCIEGDVIHYVYVREAFRRKGIAKWLLGDLKKYRYYTHRSRALTNIRLPRHLICAVDVGANPEFRKVVSDESYARHLGKTGDVQPITGGSNAGGGTRTGQAAGSIGHRATG